MGVFVLGSVKAAHVQASELSEVGIAGLSFGGGSRCCGVSMVRVMVVVHVVREERAERGERGEMKVLIRGDDSFCFWKGKFRRRWGK